MTFATRYCAYIPPPNAPTFLPSKACAASESPAAITVPAPSFPVASAIPNRAAKNCTAPGLALALILVSYPEPDEVSDSKSIGAVNNARSDGLIGAAST